jgi:hypothetical protein
MTTLLVCLFLAFLALPVQAAVLGLAWEFPRDYADQPASFRISYTSSATPGVDMDAMSVPPSAVGACTAFADATANTYCAVWPVCPAAGTVILFWVQAVWASGVTSDASNIANCLFLAAQPCACLDPGQEIPPPPPEPLPSTTTPDYWTAALAVVLSAAPAPAT